MGYTKQNFKNGQTLDAEHLIKMEDAILACEDSIANLPTTEGSGSSDCHITYLSSDTTNMINLRDLASGTYVLYGKFRPYAESTATLSFASELLVNVITKTAGTHVQVFYPVDNCVQFLNITDDSYVRTNVYLNDLAKYIGTLSDLTTEEKSSLVGAINEVVGNIPVAVNEALSNAKASGEFDGKDAYTPQRGIDYWTDTDQESMVQDVVDTLSETVGTLNPDMVTGENGEVLTTDSAKLQRCFDMLSTSGGVISINRIYTLTNNIYVSHNSSANNNLITVVGVGKQAGINFGAYCFQGADTTTRAYGGVIFKDLWLTGTGIGFNCTHLIRLTFDNCMIRNFSNFLYCTDCLQSVYLMGCYIRASSSGISDGSVKETIKSTTACDLKIIGCVAEQGYGLLNVTNSMDGCSITDSCIEGYSSVPIILPVSNRAVNISNNYFEANNGTNIDATAATSAATISICNNLFCEYHGEDEYSGVIKLPTSVDNGYMTVFGNHCNYAYTVLLLVPDGATDLSRVYAFGNYGTTNDTSGLLKMVTPSDIHKIMEGIVKGVDYWTEDDKSEMVSDVLSAMSGETWKFELTDGTTFERTVATASLTEFTSESWTFTLVDGTTINKEVSIV